MDTKNLIPLLAMPLLLLAVEIGAVLISLPVKASGIVAFEDPTSLENPVIFIVILLVFTGFLLILIKYDMKKVIAAVRAGDKEQAQAAFKTAVPVIDSAVNKGIIHKNKAARSKSRLNNRLRAMA